MVNWKNKKTIKLKYIIKFTLQNRKRYLDIYFKFLLLGWILSAHLIDGSNKCRARRIPSTLCSIKKRDVILSLKRASEDLKDDNGRSYEIYFSLKIHYAQIKNKNEKFRQ